MVRSSRRRHRPEGWRRFRRKAGEPPPLPPPKPKPDPLSSGPTPRAWCYRCRSAHAWAEACQS